jgi:hypothetical protein
MTIDIRPEVLVHRSRHDVAEYMFDPANDLAWTGGITASRPARPGPSCRARQVRRSVTADLRRLRDKLES